MNVHLIAQPQLDYEAISSWLADLGAEDWSDGFLDDMELRAADGLAELAGRRCYLSFGTELNPNVSRIRTDRAAYLANVLSSKHGSVLEHAQFTFAIEGVSRVLTHELVRHRAGTAVSQESGRYVRLTENMEFEHPDIFGDDDELAAEAEDLVEHLGRFQEKIADRLKIDEPGTPFSTKKAVTSAMRRYAPEGRSTGLIWSANVRALRHVIETRSASGAEVEIREFADQLIKIMQQAAPLLFADFTQDEEGQWVPATSKV